MLPDRLRQEDSTYILQRITEGDCCAVVGLSNTGKSHLLRSLARLETRDWLLDDQSARPTRLDDDERIFVYVDFNLMLEATEQGFYELILRCLLEELTIQDPSAEFLPQLQSAYQTLVAPPTAFQISLSFSEGLTAVCRGRPGTWFCCLTSSTNPLSRSTGGPF